MTTQPTVFESIPAATPILGFTGALGSGCSFFAERLVKLRGFSLVELSKPIHDECRSQNTPETVENLQNVGNKLRQERGPDVLVRLGLADAQRYFVQADETQRPRGIVVDGIRNAAEVEALRQYPNFLLLSIQADRHARFERLRTAKKVDGDKQFDEADGRDQEEGKRYGQQVRKCNALADIVVANSRAISLQAKRDVEKYIEEKLGKHVDLIECVARGQPTDEHHPTFDEMAMTLAYGVSMQSSCLKRQVGAVVARATREIVAVACNEVPANAGSCLEHPRYQGCYRDYVQTISGKRFKHCPECGKAVASSFSCVHCNAVLEAFCKRCPKCNADPEIRRLCECGAEYSSFLPGGKKSEAGKLLDICRALHAEEAAILSLIKSGIADLSDATLYTTTYPCNLCANKIVQSGIKRVVYAEPYEMKEAKELFKSNSVDVRSFEGVKSVAYFRIYGQRVSS